MDILTSIQESVQGWCMFFGGGIPNSAQLGGVSGAPIKPGVVEAGKQAPVVRQMPGAPAPVGVRYIPAPDIDPGTPATVVERIQKSIGDSAEGWRMGFAHVAGKAQAGIEKSLAGWGMGISHVGGKVSEGFGNIGGGLSSYKYPLYILLFVFIFIAVMVAIGYSGVGGPTARIAEREYVKRR